MKGYWSEQILSSSLFRLYRCLGGDDVAAGTATPEVVARERAAHYAVYLIIRAIGLLGEARYSPARVVDQFVTALIEADVTKSALTYEVPDGSGNAHQVTRIGGCAHKLVRWAFEAQGLYAANAGETTDRPGAPMPVDIYIEDRRPSAEWTPYGSVQYAPGGYPPVSLDWGAPGAPPAWHAADSAIEPRNGAWYVKVRNRGSDTALSARDVRVRVWWHDWPTNTGPPMWDGGAGWHALDVNPVAAQDVPAGGEVEFGPFAPSTPVPTAPGTRYIVLAEANCAADAANTDPYAIVQQGAMPGADLPCSWLPTPLVDLVAGDNNLGLRVFVA
jgi:hypothetical protein